MKCICLAVLIGSVVTSASAQQKIAPSKETAMQEIVRLPSHHAFTDTIERVEAGLSAHGFTIFAVIDQRAAAQSVGLDMPATSLVIYGNPKGGTPLMLAAPDFALELPLRVLVREEPNGGVTLVYAPASALDGRYGLPAGMAARLAASEAVLAAAAGP